MTGHEHVLLAVEAGLRYVGPEAAGFRRVRGGRGFSYVDGDGAAANSRIRERIESRDSRSLLLYPSGVPRWSSSTCFITWYTPQPSQAPGI